MFSPHGRFFNWIKKFLIGVEVSGLAEGFLRFLDEILGLVPDFRLSVESHDAKS